jgi:GTP cyclohydrolase I
MSSSSDSTKKNGTHLANTHQNGETDHELLGDAHVMTGIETPMREDAFQLSDEEKIERIEEHFEKIMQTLGLDTTDESLRGTPRRVAKMYVQEVFSGLNPANMPDARKFSNKYEYGHMVVEKNIRLNSFCEHHFLPFIGKAHVGYISRGKVIGLSKINRMVEYFASRPQVQERLTLQIAEALEKALETPDVAVYIDSKHLCVSTRGIKDDSSSTVTADYRGAFKEPENQQRFIDYIKTELK